MTACRCGSHDVAPTWTLFVPVRAPSMNERLHNSAKGGWAYRKARNEWVTLLVSAMAAAGVPFATGPRRIVLTRVYGGQEKQRDYGNLVGGLKMVVDAMCQSTTRRGTERAGAGLIVDDSPALLDDVYLQERSSTGQSGLRIEIADLPDEGQMSLPSATVVAS